MSVFLGLIATVVQLIWKLVLTVIKTVYEVLRILRIRMLALYLIICGIVQLFWRSFSQEQNLSYFWLGFALVCALTVIGWVFAAIRSDRKNRAERERNESERAAARESAQQEKQLKRQKKKEKRMGQEVKSPPIASVTGNFPIYYTAEGHEDYIFAEYDDRYELFRKQEGGFVYVRTDYKQRDSGRKQA